MQEKMLTGYKRLLALTQAGLCYGKDSFDQERHREMQEIIIDLVTNFNPKKQEQL